MHSSQEYTPESTYLCPNNFPNNHRRHFLAGASNRTKNKSPIFMQNAGNFQANNYQYLMQHSKWDNLRNKIKMMKLDNITVRSYKDANKTCYKFNTPNQKMKEFRETDNLTEMYTSVKISKNQAIGKGRDFLLEGSTRELLSCYTQSAQKKPNRQSFPVKRIFHSKTNPRSGNSQLGAAYKIKNRDLAKRSKSNASAQRINNPESLSRTQKKNPTNPQTQNKDLENISKITMKDIQQRIIVRKKSEISDDNMIILAWESSIVRKKNILFTCEEIKQNKEIEKDYKQEENENDKKLDCQTYRLILGPAQCSKYCQCLSIDDLPRIASVLLDFLSIDTFHKKLKITKSLLHKQKSKQFKTHKEEIIKAIDNSPYIWVPTVQHIKQRMKPLKNKTSPFSNNELVNISDSKNLHNCNKSQKDQLQSSLTDNQQEKKIDFVNKRSEKMSEIAQEWSRMEHSKNITEEIQQSGFKQTVSIKQQKFGQTQQLIGQQSMKIQNSQVISQIQMSGSKNEYTNEKIQHSRMIPQQNKKIDQIHQNDASQSYQIK